MIIERQRLLNLIKMHERWIKTNSVDSDGVKERREWIEDCESELAKLELECPK